MRSIARQIADLLVRAGSSPEPLYKGIARAIVTLAEAGALEHGVRLPSERALAKGLGVSRNSVTAAYQSVRDAGWLEGGRGAAPRLGIVSRAAQEYAGLSQLMHTEERTFALDVAAPAAAPAVREALADPDAFLDGSIFARSGYATLGNQDFALAVAAHLRRQGIAADAADVVPTNGAQQALWLAIAALGQRAPLVAVEAVTYPGVFDVIRAAGGKSLALPMASGGLDVGAATSLIRSVRPAIVYLTAYQNPTGMALEPEQAAAIVKVARRHGALLVDDRTLAELSLDGSVCTPLATVPGAGPVVTVGSLSKLFWGGLRLGWLHTNKPLAAQLREKRAGLDLGGPAFLQRVGARLLEQHYEATLTFRLQELRTSLDAARRAMRRHKLPWDYAVPRGGPSLWVKLPPGSGERFAKDAASRGVGLAMGEVFEASAGAGKDYLRLPFVLPPREMRQALALLARCGQG